MLQIGITTGRDLQVRVSLSAAIQDVLNIRIRYINEEDKAVIEQHNDENFINTLDISLLISSVEIPYSTFRVQIAMVVNGVTGEYTPESDVYGKVISNMYKIICIMWYFLLDKSVAQPLPGPDTSMGQSNDDDHVPLIVGVSAAVIVTVAAILAVPIALCTCWRWKRSTVVVFTEGGTDSQPLKTFRVKKRQQGAGNGTDSQPLKTIRVVIDSANELEPPPPAYSEQENGMELVTFTSE